MICQTTLRVKTIICPSCKGSGRFHSSDGAIRIACFWCRGDQRLDRATALRYSEQVYSRALWGYLDEHLDLATMRQLQREARDVAQIFADSRDAA